MFVTYSVSAKALVAAGLTIAVLGFIAGAVVGPMILGNPPSTPIVPIVKKSEVPETPRPGFGCRGQSCNDKDPADMGCDKDAEIVDTVPDGPPKVHLRFSPSCDAAWVQKDRDDRNYDASVRTAPADSSPSIEYRTGEFQYSHMIPYHYKVQACVQPIAGAGPQCTKVHQG